MHPQLNGIVGDLQSAEERLGLLQAALPYDVWRHRPGQSRWSPADCIEHLNLTSEALLPLLRAGLDEAGDRLHRSASRYRRDVVGWLIWKAVAPSGGLRTRTVAAFAPAGNRPLDVIIADFARLQSEVIACVRAANGLPIDHIKLASPFDARVRYNLYAALTMVPRHQHRHLLQAERAADVAMLEVPALAV